MQDVAMNGLPWGTIISLVVGIGTIVVIPLMCFWVALSNKVTRVETKVDGMQMALGEVKANGHGPCPYVQIRTEHHEKILQLERAVSDLWRWKEEINRMLIRRGMPHGESAEGVDSL